MKLSARNIVPGKVADVHKGVTTTTVTEDEAGMRVDRWFKRRYPTLALSPLAQICRKGEVRVEEGAKEGERFRIEVAHRGLVEVAQVLG